MSARRKRPVASLDAAEQLPQNTLPLLPPRSLFFSVLPRRSNFLSVKPCWYLLPLIFICLFTVVPAIAQVDKVVYWAPWVTKTTINSATINWYGASNAAGAKAGEIEYATTSYYKEHGHFDKTAESRTTGAYQHTQLTGLEPNTSYTYRVTTSDTTPHVFSVRTFRTMPVSGPFTFIVISDTHAQLGRFKYVAAAIAANETDALFILHGGDYAGHDSVDEWTLYFDAADVMLAKFPIFTTIGNHEYHRSPEAPPPTEAVQYHSAYNIDRGMPLNHYFDCAGIRFIILNSPDPTTATSDDPHTSLALAQSQAPWLAGLLKDNMAGTFTIHHHPIWNFDRTTINPDLKPWEDLYHAYPISANFAGHTHNYQRYSVMGIPYFVVGNAGGTFSDLTPPPYAVWWITGETRQLGYLRVTVDPAKNTATATEIFVASVDDTVVPEIITVYTTPITFEAITFSLKPSSGTSSSCFIATAAFGSYLDPCVKILRNFRDAFLLTNPVGRSFVTWYYNVSPPIADLITRNSILSAGVRIMLLPAIGIAFLCLKVGVVPTAVMLFVFCALFAIVIRSGWRRFSHLAP